MSETILSLMQGASKAQPSLTAKTYVPVAVDANGVAYVKVVVGTTQLNAVDLTADGQTIPAGLPVASANEAFNGATWDRVRSANIFNSAAATAAGNTAVWTPAAGKKFRLLAWRLSVAGTLAAAGTQTIQLLDGAVIIARAGANVSNVYPANDSQIGEDYGLQGKLSAAINNVLNINLSAAMTNGGVFIDVWGTEE